MSSLYTSGEFNLSVSCGESAYNYNIISKANDTVIFDRKIIKSILNEADSFLLFKNIDFTILELEFKFKNNVLDKIILYKKFKQNIPVLLNEKEIFKVGNMKSIRGITDFIISIVVSPDIIFDFVFKLPLIDYYNINNYLINNEKNNKADILKSYKNDFINKNEQKYSYNNDGDEEPLVLKRNKQTLSSTENDCNNDDSKNVKLIKFKEKEAAAVSNGCVICFSDDINIKSFPNNCFHCFCFDCIYQWSEVYTYCPICKIQFDNIIKYDGEFDKTISVNVTTKVKESSVLDEEDEIIMGADEYCYNCLSSDEPNFMLICDSCNKMVCHIKCLSPPTQYIPLGEWFCNFCRRNKNLTCDVQDADLTGENNLLRKKLLLECAIRSTERTYQIKNKKIKKEKKKVILDEEYDTFINKSCRTIVNSITLNRILGLKNKIKRKK